VSASPIDPHRLAEDTKRQLLERAAELDQDSLTLQQLREAAVEAGISAAAFDQAVHEWRHTMPVASAVSRPVTVAARLLRNFAALASGWAALRRPSAKLQLRGDGRVAVGRLDGTCLRQQVTASTANKLPT